MEFEIDEVLHEGMLTILREEMDQLKNQLMKEMGSMFQSMQESVAQGFREIRKEIAEIK